MVTEIMNGANMADNFGGSELDSLRQKAEEVLGKAKTGLKILCTTVISPDWKEESVIEWSDTTRSAFSSVSSGLSPYRYPVN